MQHHSTTGDSSLDRDALILACSEPVKAMAWKFVRNSSCLEFDEVHSIGMLAVCEAAPNLQLGRNPFPYLLCAAKLCMIDEYRRVRGCSSSVSLDAPLTSEDDAFTLHDILPAPVASSWCSQALDAAMQRLASSRQRAVLCRRYGLPGYGASTLKQTARDLRTTVGAVNSAGCRGLRELACDVRLCKVIGVGVVR